MDESEIYRSISLFSHGDTSASTTVPKATSQQLIDRILDPTDSISTHIKEISIGDWTQQDGDHVLCKVLERLDHLESFR